jgi:uncharacterized protein
LAAMGYRGGWPLSIFLTPDRKPFFGGTYFPPEQKLGSPGFKKVLKTIAEYYHANRHEVSAYSQKLLDLLKPKHTEEGEISKQFIGEAMRNILSALDPRNGGFGHSPKFAICR